MRLNNEITEVILRKKNRQREGAMRTKKDFFSATSKLAISPRSGGGDALAEAAAVTAPGGELAPVQGSRGC